MAINDEIRGRADTPVEQVEQVQAGANAPSPEDQEAYERTVLAGIKALSDPKSNPQIMQALGSGGDPARQLASTTAAIMTQLDEQSGGTIPELVIMPAAGEILENVATFANESGVMKVDANIQNQATQYLIMDLADTYDIPPEDIEELTAGLSEQEIGGIVEEQGAIANSGAAGQELEAPQQAPQGQLPGIINQTIGA